MKPVKKKITVKVKPKPKPKLKPKRVKKEVNKGGRPTVYNSSYNRQAYKLCLLGYTNKEIADFFGINEDTIYDWKHKYPKFSESIREGRENADSNVAESLYKRALGYTHKEDKIFQYEGKPVVVKTIKHYPPDTEAAKHWLNNRQKDKWRNKVDTEHSGEIKTNIIGQIPIVIATKEQQEKLDKEANNE